MGMIYKKKINLKFFKKWSPEMAYILGYITADGCLIKRKDRKNSWVLNITSKDKYHLKNLRRSMDSNYEISPKNNGRGDISYQLQISYLEICQDVRALGIHPRKTFTLKPIKVPNRFFPDFVRGYFDADGTVYIYMVNNTLQIKASFVSCSFTFIAEFNQRLCKSLGVIPKSIHRDHPDKRSIRYSIYFYIDDCQKLAAFMYKNKPSLHLFRKCRIFEKWASIKRRGYIKNNYPSKVGWQLN